MIVASAAETKDLGGWSEDEGYYTNVLTRATVKHTGQRESKSIDGNTNYRAHGWTTWSGVYHYTTARMEGSNSVVFTTSGRQWGSNGTEAISPWWKWKPDVSNYARTYYGH